VLPGPSLGQEPLSDKVPQGQILIIRPIFRRFYY
jgi:hypothetical protein